MVHDGANACVHGRCRTSDLPWVAQVSENSRMVQGRQAVRHIACAKSTASEDLVRRKVDPIQIKVLHIHQSVGHVLYCIGNYVKVRLGGAGAGYDLLHIHHGAGVVGRINAYKKGRILIHQAFNLFHIDSARNLVGFCDPHFHPRLPPVIHNGIIGGRMVQVCHYHIGAPDILKNRAHHLKHYFG